LNGTDSRVGSLTADWERFFEWKRIAREDEPRRAMLRGTCDRTRLLDMVENFTLLSEHMVGWAKIIGQNHQVLGVNAAIASLRQIRPALANPATLTPTPLPGVVFEHIYESYPEREASVYCIAGRACQLPLDTALGDEKERDLAASEPASHYRRMH
jgi:hypothetical protein